MLLQVARLREVLLADEARVRLHAGVSPHVNLSHNTVIVNYFSQFIQRITAKTSNALNMLVSGKEESLQSYFKPITRVSTQFICQ